MANALDTNTRAFLDEPHLGTLATVSPPGIPHQVLVWYLLAGDELLISTPATSYKVGVLRANPWASLSVSAGSRYVTARGQARVDENRDQGAALYRRIATRYLGEEQADAWLAQASRRGAADRVTIHLPIEHLIMSHR